MLELPMDQWISMQLKAKQECLKCLEIIKLQVYVQEKKPP